MANVIDALVVTLGLDSDAFKKGTKEAEQAQEEFTKKTEQDSKKREQQSKKASAAETKRAQQFHKQAKETAEQFRKIKTQALGLAAVFTGGLGIEEFMSQAVNSSANAFEMSRNMNMSARQIGAVEGVFQQLGGSIGEAHSALQSFQQSIAERKLTGNLSSQFSTYARYSGNSVTPLSEIHSPLEYMRAGAQYAQMNPDHLTKSMMTTVLGQMGFKGPLLSAIRGGLGSFNKRFRENESSSYSNTSAKEMQKFRDEWVKMERELKKVGRTLVTAMAPDIEKLMGAVSNFANWAASHQKQITTFFKQTSSAIVEFLQDVKAAAVWLGYVPKSGKSKNKSSQQHKSSSATSTLGSLALQGSLDSAREMKWFYYDMPMDIAHGIASWFGWGSGNNNDSSPMMSAAVQAFSRPQSLAIPNINDYWRRIHGGTVHNTTNHTTVGDVTVNTQASDAQGTADALHSRLYSLVPLADTAEQ